MKKKLFFFSVNSTEKKQPFWPKIVILTLSRINVCTSLQGKHQGPSFMLELGIKCAKNAYIWPKMTQKCQ